MDTGEWRRIDEPAAVTDIGEDGAPRPSRLVQARRQWQRYLTRHGRRGAVVGLGATFVLLFASEWMPWAHVTPQSNPTTGVDTSGDNIAFTFSSSPNGGFNVGIGDANTLMIVTYHLMWVIVLGLAGATVFASRRVRQPLFGATIGATVVQFVAIVPLLRHPKGLIVNAISDIASGSDATALVVTRGAGMFCGVAALVVLAGSMVFAVQGNVLPTATADDRDESIAATPDIEPEIRAADPEIDIEVLPEQSTTPEGRHSVPPAMGTAPEPAGPPDVVAFTVEAVEGLPEHPELPTPPATVDHSAYARPLGPDQYQR